MKKINVSKTKGMGMRKFLDWSDRYRIGHPVIDSQHKELFKIINTLHENGDNAFIQKNCFTDLQTYVVKHFTTEEEIMRLYRYPEEKIVAHQKEHQSFAERVAGFSQASKKGEKTEEIALIFLKTWITQHVLDSDRDLIDCLKVPLKI